MADDVTLMGMSKEPPVEVSMFLELGAGDRPYEDGRGWVHNDFREGPDIEIVCPAEMISQYVSYQVQEIRATHLLEHFSHLRTVEVLKEWHSLLLPGGTLYVEVPNLKWQIHAYITAEITTAEFVHYAYGGQDYVGNAHYTGFDEFHLRNSLMDAGFNVVGITDIGQVLCAKAVK